MYKEKLLRNINYYGVQREKRKLAEEVDELIEAITEYEFAKKTNEICLKKGYEEIWDLDILRKHIVEELGDTMTVLEQFRFYYMLLVKEITESMRIKIDRQMNRIDEEVENDINKR